MKGRAGLTVVELVAALAIAAVVGSVGVPYLLASMPTVRLNGATHQVLGDLRLARTLAVARGTDVLIQFDSPAENQYTLVYDTDPPPPNGDHLVTGRDEAIKTVKLSVLYDGIELARYGAGTLGRGPSGSDLPPDGVSFQDGTCVFNPDGRARAGSVYLRPSRNGGTPRANERCITVTGSTSRARVYCWRGTTWE